MPRTELDPRDARPLTSREISKVLCSIIAGVVVYDPASRHFVPDVIAACRRHATIMEADAVVSPFMPEQPATWAAAISATVSGLRGWCAPPDIAAALAWVAENLHEICPPNGPPVVPTN